MNDEKIYYYDQVTSPPIPSPGNQPIAEYVLNNMLADFDRLPDGSYILYLDNIVINTNGQVVYFANGGISDSKPYTEGINFHFAPKTKTYSKLKAKNRAIKKAMWKKLSQILDDIPPMQPAKLDGKPVISVIPNDFGSYRINVRNHNSSISKL